MIRDRIVGLKKVLLANIRGFSGGNPKSRNTNDRQMLGDSLDNHGYVIPMAVRAIGDGTYELIDGHGRLEAISERDSGGEIRVLVLDVATVAEGRRILLALQHTAGWDVDKLEEFVRKGLAEGLQVADLMVDTGLTDKHLSAFAQAGQAMMDDLAESAAVASSTGDADEDATNEGGPSRAGLNPEHVAFSLPITREQSKTISAALKLAKQLHSLEAKGDALAAICAFYVETKRAEKAEKKSASVQRRAKKS